MQNAKNIFFVAFIQTQKDAIASFCVWLGHSCFACHSASAKRETEWGSHSPLGDL